MKIIILYTEPSDVSRLDEIDTLNQSLFIQTLLEQKGHQVILLPCNLNQELLRSQLVSIHPDLVFNFTEGLNGMGQFIHFPAAILETLSMPFTGASSEALYVTSHKTLAKQWLAFHQLPTPTWYDRRTLTHASAFLAQQYIIKSLWEHSSLGLDEHSITTAQTASQLAEKIQEKERLCHGPCYAEAFISGREFNVSLLETEDGVMILPIAEIQFIDFGKRPSILSFRAKWDEDSFEACHTKRSFTFSENDQNLLELLSRWSLRCWSLFKLTGYARVDFRIDQQDNPFILEINTNPCLSQDAGFMAAAQQGQFSPTQIVQAIMQAALKTK